MLEELGGGLVHWALHASPDCPWCKAIDEAFGSPQGSRILFALPLIEVILQELSDEPSEAPKAKGGSRRCRLCPSSRMRKGTFHLHELTEGEVFTFEGEETFFIIRSLSSGTILIEPVKPPKQIQHCAPGAQVCRV